MRPFLKKSSTGIQKLFSVRQQVEPDSSISPSSCSFSSKVHFLLRPDHVSYFTVNIHLERRRAGSWAGQGSARELRAPIWSNSYCWESLTTFTPSLQPWAATTFTRQLDVMSPKTSQCWRTPLSWRAITNWHLGLNTHGMLPKGRDQDTDSLSLLLASVAHEMGHTV